MPWPTPATAAAPCTTCARAGSSAVINSVLVKKTKEAALTDPSGITYAIPVRYVRALLAGSRLNEPGRPVKKLSILMVCTANICRSPMAEGLLLLHAEREGLGKAIVVQSAGTHVRLGGQRPDARAQRAAASVGADLGRMRSRQVQGRDFIRHDSSWAWMRGTGVICWRPAPPSMPTRSRC